VRLGPAGFSAIAPHPPANPLNNQIRRREMVN
jgi:hypothetical protein